MRKSFFTCLFASFSIIVHAQLTGTISNAKGEILPFANVYLEGTTRGTTANTEGGYFFDLADGTYSIVFQSIGYTKKVQSIKVAGKTRHDIVLDAAEVELSEVVVKANAEDPAYPIVRKAIENRSYFLKQVKSFSCDVYIKGVQRIADAPKKIMGQDLGDMNGTLDTTTRSGIIYLAETVSKLHVSGKNKKEELITSKVSGNDNGFGFNRATLFDFNLYENFNNDLPRKIMSPIAENALNNYRYKLVSSSRVDEQTVYKIEVIPIRKEDPTWAGHIHIVDNQWNLYATDVYVTGRSLQQEIVDTVWLQQSFIKLNKDVWRVFNQRLDFKFKLLSLKFKGFFNGVFSNYALNPSFPNQFFGDELFTAINATKTNDLKQWETIRPIPLTAEEIRDYKKKDSVQVVHQSKPYIDSMMRRANRFKPINLLTGYDYRNDYKSTHIGFGSVLSAVNFNAIQGLNLTLPFNYSKDFKDSLFAPTRSTFKMTPSVNYSFAAQKWRGEFNGDYLFNRFTYDKLTVNFGKKVQQFNPSNIITRYWAMEQALYEKRHIYFVYDRIFANMAYQRDITNGLWAKIGFEVAQRAPLSISTQYSFKKKGEIFNNNNPIFPRTEPSNLARGEIITADFTMSWTPHVKYTTYPYARFNEEPRFPVAKVYLKHAFGNSINGRADFTKMELSIEQSSLPIGLLGYSEIRAEYGSFLRKNRLIYADYQHFNGHDFNIAGPLHYMRGFFQLPYYAYSTTNNYVMAHGQHHFEGFLLGKLPLIRRLGFKEVVRVAYLNTPDLGNYAEAGIGIDNIGYGLFRLFRVDCSWQYINGKVNKTPKFMLGINGTF
ncbi:MAG: DUF5686 and carboxypeptidase regulatory-like domain-containing protein [Saprospiraceae bacterium]|nr:DUF5686 and carboxypeptidase regulatory-like domain-containing protein [Saprospiraceae bacterium]